MCLRSRHSRKKALSELTVSQPPVGGLNQSQPSKLGFSDCFQLQCRHTVQNNRSFTSLNLQQIWQSVGEISPVRFPPFTTYVRSSSVVPGMRERKWGAWCRYGRNQLP